MKLRIASSATLAMTLAFVTTGCSSGDDAGDPNSFEFWSFTEINQQAAVDEYLKDNPDVTVELTEVGSSVETAQALTTALAGGKVPDLVLIQGDDLPKFVEQPQNFHDLRELGADEMQGDYLDWVISQSTAAGGEIIGIPTDVGGMAIAYRTDLFAEAGLPTDREEVGDLWPTWDDFIEIGETYTETTGEPFLDNASTSIFFQASNQGPMKFYDDDRNLAYDQSPQVKAAFDYSLEAIETGITARQSSFSSGWRAGMAEGDFAVMSAPSWMLNQIRDNAPETEGLWDIATIPGGAGNWGGSYLAIPARAENPQAAWDYISEMQSPEGQLGQFVRSGSLPTTPSVYDDPQLTSFEDPFFNNAPIGVIYTDSVLGLEPFYIGPDSSAIGQEFLNAITSVEEGDGDPAQAWDTALTNVANAIGQ